MPPGCPELLIDSHGGTKLQSTLWGHTVPIVHGVLHEFPAVAVLHKGSILETQTFAFGLRRRPRLAFWTGPLFLQIRTLIGEVSLWTDSASQTVKVAAEDCHIQHVVALATMLC